MDDIIEIDGLRFGKPHTFRASKMEWDSILDFLDDCHERGPLGNCVTISKFMYYIDLESKMRVALNRPKCPQCGHPAKATKST